MLPVKKLLISCYASVLVVATVVSAIEIEEVSFLCEATWKTYRCLRTSIIFNLLITEHKELEGSCKF